MPVGTHQIDMILVLFQQQAVERLPALVGGNGEIGFTDHFLQLRSAELHEGGFTVLRQFGKICSGQTGKPEFGFPAFQGHPIVFLTGHVNFQIG